MSLIFSVTGHKYAAQMPDWTGVQYMQTDVELETLSSWRYPQIILLICHHNSQFSMCNCALRSLGCRALLLRHSVSAIGITYIFSLLETVMHKIAHRQAPKRLSSLHLGDSVVSSHGSDKIVAWIALEAKTYLQNWLRKCSVSWCNAQQAHSQVLRFVGTK